MLRTGMAYLLSALVALTGLILADARGSEPVLTTDLTICSGTTFTIISINPDGQPVEKTTPCPDGTAIFAATFDLPGLAQPAPRLVAVVDAPARVLSVPVAAPSPSARGPPVLI